MLRLLISGVFCSIVGDEECENYCLRIWSKQIWLNFVLQRVCIRNNIFQLQQQLYT